jgi:hypothetical protein
MIKLDREGKNFKRKMLKLHNFRCLEVATKLDMIASGLDRLKALNNEIERNGVFLRGDDGIFYANPALEAEIQQKKAYFYLLDDMFE